MKKLILITVLATMMSAKSLAQNDSQWTLNTRGWCTNYWTYLIYNVVQHGVKAFAFHGHSNDSLWAERILPFSDLVFPIGMAKSGFDNNNIYGPFHRAFGNPFKHIGDWGIGLDVSYMPAPVGVYAGAYFKSQELVFKEESNTLRGFYFQPRAGLIFGTKEASFETGVFYDIVTGCSSTYQSHDKKMLKGGLGLDFALSVTGKNSKSKAILEFSMPLHNFFDTSYPNQADFKRKVGYIRLTRRICF